MLYWGKHLILDIAKCYPPSIRCATHISNFSKQLVKDIDMIPYGDPQVVHFGEGNKAGYTLTQLITTSNIMAHFVEEDNSIFLDVFSCKDFDKEVVKGLVNKYFMPLRMNEMMIERKAPYVSTPDLP